MGLWVFTPGEIHGGLHSVGGADPFVWSVTAVGMAHEDGEKPRVARWR